MNVGFFFIYLERKINTALLFTARNCSEVELANPNPNLSTGLTGLEGPVGGRGPLGSPHTGPSSSVRRLFHLCNRSHVSTFAHALESRALSGTDLGGADLSLPITLCVESYAERVKRVEWQRAWIYPRPTLLHRAAPPIYHSFLGSSTPHLSGERKTLQQKG